MTDLCTVVVNWNTIDLLDDCLASIVAATPEGLDHEVIVVDNGSHDGSVAHLQRRWPTVRLIVNADNVGFCRANNQAIRQSAAPVVLLVNTDARLAADGIAALLSYFDQDPQAAVVGPRLVYADDSFQRWTAGRLPGLASLAIFLFGLDRLPIGRRRGLYLGQDTHQPFRPEWVSSAVMALRRSALDEIGLLDEEIFVYMDDVDLCQRATAAGWHVWYAADTTATHLMGGSSARSGRASPAALRALNGYYARRHGPASTGVLRGLEVLGFGARVLAHAAAATAGRTGARTRMRTHAVHVRTALEPV